MATSLQISAFIALIAPLIQAECKIRGYAYPSAIIAQACVESAFGTSQLGYKYHNFFGMKCGSSWKGKSVNLKTKEEYTVGNLTTIRDNFRVYDTDEDGIKGYFDFISSSRYQNLKNATSSKNYIELLKQDGYATSSTYVNTVYSYVERYNLTQYDNSEEFKPLDANIVKLVLTGAMGNGSVREQNVIAAGYNYQSVRVKVNQICSAAEVVKPFIKTLGEEYFDLIKYV